MPIVKPIDFPFVAAPKTPRLSRDITITEKLDGTRGTVVITEVGDIFVGSRNRWIAPEDDNYGFARWVENNREEILKFGPGRFEGEWWGNGIQRNYGIAEKRFSLFNTAKWSDPVARPACCHVVPVLYTGNFDTERINYALECLKETGSIAAPGFMQPEGIVIFHSASGQLFKKTALHDEQHKSQL